MSKESGSRERRWQWALVAVGVLAVAGGVFIITMTDWYWTWKNQPLSLENSGGMIANCFEPIEPPRRVAKDYEDYLGCVDATIDTWFEEHPEEVERLEKIYQVWEQSRGVDLLGTPEAAAHVEMYPTEFSKGVMYLSPAEVRDGIPTLNAEPVRVYGQLERIYFDGHTDRLLIGSRESGLISLAMRGRYDFVEEGPFGELGQEDFFIYDDQTVFVRERIEGQTDADLVVYDISTRSQFEEISRTRGIIAQGRLGTRWDTEGGAPSFVQYVNRQEYPDSFDVAAKCGPRPTSWRYRSIHCDASGDCYRESWMEGAPTGLELKAEEMSCDEMCFRNNTWEGEDGTFCLVESGPYGVPEGPYLGESAEPEERIGAGGEEVHHQEGAERQWKEGLASSSSRMVMYGEFLYVLSIRAPRWQNRESTAWLSTFDMSDPGKPELVDLFLVENGPVALAYQDNLLLIASRTGVFAASVANPAAPQIVGEFKLGWGDEYCKYLYDAVVMMGSQGFQMIASDMESCSAGVVSFGLEPPNQPRYGTKTSQRYSAAMAIQGQLLFIGQEDGVKVMDFSAGRWEIQKGKIGSDWVKDLVVHDFDLFVLSDDEVKVFYIGDLYAEGVDLAEVVEALEGRVIVRRGPEE